jgi:Domain of unknown function (DUF5009)
MNAPIADASSDRKVGLDALRGWAIIWMAMAAVIPAGLPNFFFHGNFPSWILNDAGEWVRASGFQARWGSYTIIDWVFPGFLFAMGAAIPAALMPRLSRGESRWKLAVSVLIRTAGLMFFALYVRVVSPGEWMKKPGDIEYTLALLAFFVPFLLYVRLPKTMSPRGVWATRIGGVVAMVGMMGLASWWGGHSFNATRADVIILVLAQTYALAALSWIVLRKTGLWLAVMLVVGLVAHHESINAEKFGDWRFLGSGFSGMMYWLDSPYRWLSVVKMQSLWSFSYYQHGIVVGLGMAMGQVMLSGISIMLSKSRAIVVMLSAMGVMLSVLIGLRHYGAATFGMAGVMTTPWPTVVLGGPMLVVFLIGVWTLRDPKLRTMLTMSAGVLVVGVVLSVLSIDGQWFQGGIKKGPPATMSYYLVSAGVSGVMLIALTMWADIAKLPGMKVAALVGQNALLAYIAIRNVMVPLLNLPLTAWVSEHRTIHQYARLEWFTTPWLQLIWAVLIVSIFSAGVALLTRYKVVWRA